MKSLVQGHTYSREVLSWAPSPRFPLEPVLALAHRTSKFLPGEITGTQPPESLASLHSWLYFASFPVDLNQPPSPEVVADFAAPWGSYAEDI